tara:strand:- start:342 stop:713 length:372 start_codon:yes stop_codon:yes gene_type:complete
MIHLLKDLNLVPTKKQIKEQFTFLAYALLLMFVVTLPAHAENVKQKQIDQFGITNDDKLVLILKNEDKVYYDLPNCHIDRLIELIEEPGSNMFIHGRTVRNDSKVTLFSRKSKGVTCKVQRIA